MFKQNCFIRIEGDFSLIDKISRMGYQPLYLNYKYNLMGKNLVLEHGTWHYTDSDNHPNSIDCGINKELFLGIAAINDENCKNQYICCAEDPGQIILCTEETIEGFFTNDEFDYYNSMWSLYDKATVPEIINYFKDKE